MANITIQLHVDTDCVTIKEYARRTGIPEGTVRKAVQNKEIPILPKQGKEAVKINLPLMITEALVTQAVARLS